MSIEKIKSEKAKALFAEVAKGKAEISKIKEELSSKIKDSFHSIAKELFVIYPDLKSFGWSQYTPYFNDGEPCEFRTNTGDVTINGFNSWDSYDEDEENEMVNILDKAENDPYYQEIVDTIREFLSQFDNDDYYDLFDDHVEVTVTADGIETQEYQHD